MVAQLSVVIAAKNEEKKLPGLLESVVWADEIIVVDMFSTDRTVEIARRYTDKIYQHDSERETGFKVPEPIAVNKNLGFEKATGDWILELDADERLSHGLVDEIKAVLEEDDVPYDGFVIPFHTYFFGHRIRYGGWQHDEHVRFFRKGAAKWDTNIVHRPHLFDGRLGHLHNPIIHYMCDSLSEFIHKMEFYTSQEAEFYSQSGRPFKLRNLLIGTPRQFFKRYVRLQGFRDGMAGLIMCGAYTCYSFFLHAKLWELYQRGGHETEP
jgi:glycosyltransferase involved in cell wall biosynthesis